MSDIERVQPDASFLAPHIVDDTSLEGMEEYRILPALKIIQAMSDKTLKQAYGEGSVLIMPGGALVCKEGEKFLFVAHDFYPEFGKWSDLNDTDSPMVVSRSYDPSSELARKADDAEQRHEPYGDGNYKYTYVHHLRFPGIIYGDHALAGTPATLSFERGEHFQGKSFISAVQMRKAPSNGGFVKIPLWAQVWELSPTERTRGTYSWIGFDFKAAGIIKPEEAEEMKAAHLELRELRKKDRLVVEESLTGSEKTETNGSDVPF